MPEAPVYNKLVSAPWRKRGGLQTQKHRIPLEQNSTPNQPHMRAEFSSRLFLCWEWPACVGLSALCSHIPYSDVSLLPATAGGNEAQSGFSQAATHIIAPMVYAEVNENAGGAWLLDVLLRLSSAVRMSV